MRVIPIAEQTLELAGCDEESGVVRKVNLPLARREFLKGSGLLFGSLAPEPCWQAWHRPVPGRWSLKNFLRRKVKH